MFDIFYQFPGTKLAAFNGCLDVNLIGINAVLKKVDLIASVGRPQLAIALLGKPLQTEKVHLTSGKA